MKSNVSFVVAVASGKILLAAHRPVWIATVDLSKAFDRINWSELWAGLAAHGVSQPWYG